jgi:hypothetical protein
MIKFQVKKKFMRNSVWGTASSYTCPNMLKISFAQIVKKRNADVRISDDGLLYAIDLVMVMTGSKNDPAGLKIRRLCTKSREVNVMMIERKNVGGGRATKLISFKNAIQLIMVLPGEIAKSIRKDFAAVIVRYLDGDRTMCAEIEANNAIGKQKSYSKFASGVMNRVDNVEVQRANEMPETRYIYGTKSAAYPGLIKIGKTCDLRARVSSLKTATAPAPHVIVAVALTFDTARDETFAQTFFAERRREGEFFEINDAEAVAFFATHITARYNIELAQHIARLEGMHL